MQKGCSQKTVKTRLDILQPGLKLTVSEPLGLTVYLQESKNEPVIFNMNHNVLVFCASAAPNSPNVTKH